MVSAQSVKSAQTVRRQLRYERSTPLITANVAAQAVWSNSAEQGNYEIVLLGFEWGESVVKL
jgi:hypothetical protein